MNRRCEACGRLGQIGNPDLRATLCHECDHTFIAWWSARPWCIATDWPGLNRGRPGQMAAAAQRARDASRTTAANAANHRPMRPATAELYAAWRAHRQDVTAP